VNGIPHFLQTILSANAQARVLKPVIESLGDDAIEEFANAVRLLDCRISGGELRTVETIANEDIPELTGKNATNARKSLERIVRGIIRGVAQNILGTKASQQQNLPWRTALAANAQDIIRAHGAIDVLQAWLNQRQAASSLAREEAQKKKVETYGPRNQAILAEAEAYSFKKQRGQAKTAAVHLARKKGIAVTTGQALGVIRRNKKKP
jgi:hypothetical protein